jgi:hypothetical protein
VVENGETEQQSHPGWCEPEACTWTEKGGAHHSEWVTLGPLPGTRMVVRAYLFTLHDAPQPLGMISFHHPVDDPEDIAHNAGVAEDTAPCLVLPADQVLRLNGFLTTLVSKAGVPSSR